MTNPEELIARLRSLGPGERIVYFIGFLDELRMKKPPPREVIIANVALDLAAQGRVALVQKRLSHPVIAKGGYIDWKFGIGKGFEYWAIGLSRKEKANAVA